MSKLDPNWQSLGNIVQRLAKQLEDKRKERPKPSEGEKGEAA